MRRAALPLGADGVRLDLVSGPCLLERLLVAPARALLMPVAVSMRVDQQGGLAARCHRGASTGLRAGRWPLATLQGFEHRPGTVVGQVLVVVVVDPEHRGIGAGTQALELTQEEPAVR